MDNNMEEMSMIDPDFEPQSRPRSCTWPLNRPNIGRKSEENDVAMVMEATIEEATSQEQLMAEQAVNLVPNLVSTIKQEHESFTLSQNSFQPEYGSVLIGSPASANLVTDFSSIMLSPQQQITAANNNASNLNLSFTDLTPTSSQKSFDHVSQDIKPIINELPLLSSPSQQLCTSGLTDSSSISTPGILSKPKTSSRKNAWGNMSYADLITQGIESSPDKRLTLAQIYDWMVKNVAYFKDKGDSNSSAGWKNSIRHNLSLHSKFKRIQNEGTGKSSWWIINHDAKPGKTPRRRSMETSNSKYSRSRSKAVAKQKAELLKKQQQKVSKKDSPPWTRSPNSIDGDFDHPLNKSLASDFSRPRTSSNASSVTGRISPRHGASYIPQDLEDDGPPISSPLSSSYTPGDFFLNRGDSFSLVDSFDVNSPGDSLHTDLLDSIANMEVMSIPSPMNQGNSMNSLNDDRTSIYINSVERKPSKESPSYSSPLFSQQLNNPKVSVVQGQSVGNANRGIITSPNLATLLQQSRTTKSPTPTSNLTLNGQDNLDGVSSMRRVRANTMPRLQPQPKYNMMAPNIHRPQSGESLVFSPYGAQQPQQQQNDPSSAVSPQNVYLPSMFSFNNGQQQQIMNQQQRQHANIQQQQLSQTQPDNSAGLSSLMNQNKTLYQLLGHQRGTDVQQINTNQNMPQQVNPSLQVQRPELECSMQTNNFQQQMQQQQQQQQNMPSQNTLDQQQAQQQQGGEFNNLVQMNQKFPSDINLDNQDIFDPGQLDIDTMLQEMGSPDSFGNEFNSYFPPSNTGFMEPESNLVPSITVNQPKMEESTDNSFPYSNNIQLQSMQQQMSQQQFDQQQQQQRQGMFNMTSCGDNNSRVMMGVENNSRPATMVMPGQGGSMMIASTGINQHYNRPHHALRPQSSVGSVTDYRL